LLSTYRHLTEVEERLERAERLLRRARASAILHPDAEGVLPEFSRACAFSARHKNREFAASSPTPDAQEPEFNSNRETQSFTIDEPYVVAPGLEGYTNSQSLQHHAIFLAGSEQHSKSNEANPYNSLDGPPAAADSFEWDEQDLLGTETPESGQALFVRSDSEEGESAVVDGMGTLTLSEHDGGYLGVASGAALLRLISPGAANITPRRRQASRLRPSRKYPDDDTSRKMLYDQPNPNRHIADTMIDAYFALYNVSYPIVHEPTFRAQYSEVIGRPNGNCWNFLAYVVAAIGVFTTAKSVENSDLPLLAQAKSLMQLSYLESGNLTLIQALALMSNYLQKKDMPNSGYNYLGLATKMAVGLGLHKEFQGWNIQPLKMEIRRRVWWCLSVFDIGATITFGRPVMWPAGGTDVSLPLNVHDRVGICKSNFYSRGN
jgi:transcriptional regulatory protein GAL4